MDIDLVWAITKGLVAVIFAIFMGGGLFFLFLFKYLDKEKARREAAREERRRTRWH